MSHNQIVCFVHLQDVLLTQQWLLALRASGYVFPGLTSSSALPSLPASGPVDSQPPSAEILLPRSLAREPNLVTIATLSDHAAERTHVKTTAESSGHVAKQTRSTPRAWAVFSSSGSITPIMKQLAGMDGWRVVVVAESPSAKTWVWPNVTHLTVKQQNSLGYAILQHLPKEGPG
jgi:hypothetical protein